MCVCGWVYLKKVTDDGGRDDVRDALRAHERLKRHADDEEPEVTYVDVKRILEDGRAGEDPELKDEDLIIVPQRMINF